jgi:hypothetical protein
MLLNTHTTCAPLSRKYSPLLEERLHWHSPAGSEPAPRRYRPGTINLRSSAFICGSYFAREPEIKSPIWKRTRMTQIKRIFTDFPFRVNPRHPCNPCSTSASLFVDVPEIHNAMNLQFAQTTNLRSSCRNPAGSRLRTHVCPQAYVYTPSRCVTLGAFICGLFFTRAPDINCSEFINIWCANYSSAHEPTSSDNWCRKIANKHISMTENKKRNKINENI